MAKKFDFKKIGMRAAGATAGGVTGELINTVLPNMKPMVRGLIKMAVGVIIPEIAPKSALAEAAGIGLAANGSVDVFKAVTNKSGGSGVQGIEGPEYNVDNDYKVNGNEDYVFGDENEALGSDKNDALGDSDEVTGTDAF